jgi:threonine synthase
MRYYSTNKKSPLTDFKEATIHGQAPDKGLYFPEMIPQVGKELIHQIENFSNEEIAFTVIKPYIGETIPDEKLYEIVTETINFSIPLKMVNEKIFSLELFHGPTLAFKDVGARFMSRCLGYFVKGIDRKLTVLVATSGDTGGAVANGFYNVDGIEVVILYPSGKVSPVQERQLTTLGKNIHALEVSGTFDDCQQMVKQAFADEEINKEIFLTSANSINVARWLPQQFYYFFAYKQWRYKDQPLIISVPSGNFGNICAGILAQQSGLPVAHFIAACNANDVVPKYMRSDGSVPIAGFTQPSIATLSNAMDVGNPSNFIRILEIFKSQFPALKNKLTSYSISDEETIATIQRVFEQFDYTLDPHGAVGYLSLERYLENNPDEKGIFLETAHPIKFPEAMEQITGKPLSIPSSLLHLADKRKQSTLISNNYSQLKGWLLKK